MNGAGEEEEVEGGEVVTDEQFVATVAADDVLDADHQLWSLFSRFLGNDPVKAWGLAEVTHAPECDPETGALTGKLSSTAVWKRDPNVPTPTRPLVVAAELERTDADEAA